MNFYTARDLRTSSRSIWEELGASGEAVITNNGKPAAVMIGVQDQDPEALLRAVRQARAMLAFNDMRARAQQKGGMTEEEILDEIFDYRLEKKGK